MNGWQRAVLLALHQLPAGATVQQIKQVGDLKCTVQLLRPLVTGGLVQEVERERPPLIGFALTPEGRRVVEEILQDPDGQHQPRGTLQERVPREVLREAVQAGHSMARIRMMFDVTKGQLRELLDEYDLWTVQPTRTQPDPADHDPDQVEPAGTEHDSVEVEEMAKINKHNKPVLYGRFADGHGDDRDGRAKLADEFGVTAATIDYHRRRWIAAGRPDPRQPEQEAGKDIQEQASTDAPAPESATEQAESAPDTDQGAEPAPDVQADEEEQDEAPAAAPAPEIEPKPNLPKPGAVYEGVVEDVTANYALVNIPEFYDRDRKGQHWLKGKVRKHEVADRCQDVRDVLRNGDLVNVRVQSVNLSHRGDGRIYLTLSIRQAPAHPEGPESLRPRTAEAPIVARGAEVTAPTDHDTYAGVDLASGGDRTSITTQQVTDTSESTETTSPEAPVQPTPENICGSCVKHDVCPIYLTDIYGDELELADEDKPELLRHMRVTYSPRTVAKCSAYRAG